MSEKPSCPKCKSDRIQHLEIYLKERKDAKKSSGGVIGCLFIIILILAPSLVFGVFAGSAAASAVIWPACLILAMILIYVQHQTKKQQKDLFVCLVCGERFPIILESSIEEKNSENH